MNINELVAKWREKLRQAGVLDNDMISVPGDGVVKMLNEFEAAAKPTGKSWPSDNPRLWYDHFAKTWIIKGLSSEIFSEQAADILGRDPVDGEKLNVTVTIQSQPRNEGSGG